MTREELAEAIRHATQVTRQREVLIIGSQAILDVNALHADVFPLAPTQKRP